MSPRLTDWSIAGAVGIAFASGIISLFSGDPQEWFVFALHGIAGFWLLLWGKFRLDEARRALLATHGGGEVLSDAHGFPLRLAVPGRRGILMCPLFISMQEFL